MGLLADRLADVRIGSDALQDLQLGQFLVIEQESQHAERLAFDPQLRGQRLGIPDLHGRA